MARIRLPIVLGSGGVQMAAPSGMPIPGTYLPLIAGKVTKDGLVPGVSLGDPELAGVTVETEVPDEDLNTARTALDPVKLRQRYPNHFLEGKVWSKP